MNESPEAFEISLRRISGIIEKDMGDATEPFCDLRKAYPGRMAK